MQNPGEPPVDAWSLVHAASGAGLAMLRLGAGTALVLLVAYEAAEAALRRVPGKDGGVFEHESLANVMADILVGMAGFLAARWITGRLARHRQAPGTRPVAAPGTAVGPP